MSILFFLAFLSFLWLLCLPVYWFVFSSLPERRGVAEKLEWYRKQPFWPYGFLKAGFIIANAWVLYPLSGAIVSIAVISLFLFQQ